MSGAAIAAASGSGAAASAAAAVGRAIKASGAIVKVKPDLFTEILSRVEYPLIIRKEGGLFWTIHHYMTSYQGFIFYTRSREQLALPVECEVVECGHIWIPS